MLQGVGHALSWGKPCRRMWCMPCANCVGHHIARRWARLVTGCWHAYCLHWPLLYNSFSGVGRPASAGNDVWGQKAPGQGIIGDHRRGTYMDKCGCGPGLRLELKTDRRCPAGLHVCPAAQGVCLHLLPKRQVVLPFIYSRLPHWVSPSYVWLG